jgi:hypothetical protein
VAIDPSYLPSFVQPDTAKPKRGLIASGLMTGLNEAASLEGSVIQLAGDLTGSKGVSDFGARAAAASSDAAQQSGRPDLEVAPWHDGGAPVLPWLAYQTLKQVPQLATYIAAGAALPEAVVPTSLARLGAVAPRVLGGGGLEAGASFAARKAALEAGTDFGKSVIGAELAGIPFAAGSMYQEATSKPGGAAPGDAIKALALSPVYAALDAVEPAQLKGLVSRGLEGNIAKRMLTASFAGAAMEVPQEGIQTAMEQSFRPDLTAKQKLTNIVDAAVTGGAVGGVLGGAGGIRAMKSADPAAVTTEDLAATTDQVLRPRAALPAPSVTVDAGGRAAYGSNGLDTLLATPNEGNPSDRLVNSYFQPNMQPQIESQTIIQPKQGSLRWATPLETQEQRPLGGVSNDELQSAAQVAGNYLSAREGQEFNDRDQKILDHYQMVVDELEHRNLNNNATNDNVSPADAGAVERGSDVSGGAAATNSGAPASANPVFGDTPEWARERDTLLKGVNTRGNYIGAADLDEVKATLLARLEKGSAAKGDILLAERLGVDLNEPAKVATAQAGDPGQARAATSVAANDQTMTAPAAPANLEGGDQSVEAGFQKEWQGLLSKRRGTAIQALRENLAPNRETAMRQVFDALGASSDEDVRTDGYKGLVQLARDLGIHDEQGQLTDQGVQVARAALPLETTVAAAKTAGYTGTEASAFDRGARGQTNVKLGSIEELRAYNDGKDWALNRDAKTAPIPNTATDAETSTIVDKETASQDSVGRVTRQAVTSAGVPEKQQNMQFLNQAVDQVYGATLKPSEQAQLKQMVKQGATGAELDEAARGFQEQQRYERAGFGALASPTNQPNEAGLFRAPGPFKGEIVDRTQRVRALEAQRKSVEAQQEALLTRAAQAGNKAEMARAINENNKANDTTRKYYRDVIDGFAENGDITPRERIGLYAKLVRNDFEGIENRLSQKQQVDRREFLAGVAAVAAAGISTRVRATPKIVPASIALRRQVQIGSATGALKVIKESSSRGVYRLIAAKLLRGNWEHVQLNIVGNSPYVRGETTLEDNGDSRVDIYGEDGLNEETILHEMIHAYVQQIWAGISVYTANNKALLNDKVDRGDKSIKDFLNLWHQISSVLEKQHPEIARGVGTEVWEQNVWADPDEMLSWVLTNPDAQRYLQNVDIEGNPISDQPSVWSRIIKFFANVLGLPYNTKTESALNRILGAGFAVLDTGASQKAGDFNVKFAQKLEQERSSPMAERTMRNVRKTIASNVGQSPGLASVSNAQYKDAVQGVANAVDRLRDIEGMKGKLRQVTLGWMSLHGANEFFGKWFDRSDENGNVVANGAEGYERALNEKNAIVARMAQMLTNVRDAYGALQSSNKDSAQKIVRLMQMSEFGINPTKPWKEQSEKLRTSKNAQNLERLTNEAHNVYRALLSRGHAGIYQDLRNVNDVMMLSTLSVSLHQHVDTDGYARGQLPQFAENPMDAFMREQASKDFTPADARQWWSDKLTGQLDAAFKHLEAQRAVRDNPDTDAKGKEALSTHIDDLGKRASGIQETMRQLDEAPYFHLGRYGNFFVGWRVRDSESMAKVADRLADAGFGGVVSDGTDKLRVYMRVENRLAQKNLDAAVRKMIDEGLVEPETVRTGQRTKDGFLKGGFEPQGLRSAIAEIDASDMDEDAKEIAKLELTARMVDLTPEISLTRVMTHREGIPGYSPDMMRSFDWRAQVGINALAGMVTSPKITQSFVDMRGALDDAEKGNLEDAPLEQRRGMRDIIDEYSRRERERAQWPDTHLLDQLKGISTAWFLGASMSYGFVNLTQLGATLWPELGAKHGFVEAAKAISQATPLAFKIMKEVAKHGYNVSLSRAMDAVVTQDALRKVVGKDMAEYLMRVANTGNLDIGGPSRELVRSAEGRGDGGLDSVLRYASSVGYYTETMSRLIAAIAAKQLNPKLGVEEAADHAAYVLNETMWNYARTNQGREFGKMGILGRYTPLATQFMQFQAQLTEKLFRETYAAIKGDTIEERAEARRYLKGHLAAMTVLAGTLGLPMATVLAAVIDRLKDLWDDDDEPSNIRAAYRNWLADTLGKDAAEVITHGGFRALGFDISQRIGEQDLMPLSKFLADRRNFKDKAKDLAFQTWGAPTSAIAGVLQGGDAMMDGDVMGGLTKMLPNALAAPVKAYRLTSDGYVDASGKKLPMDAGARAVLVQLLGFNPSEKAEYNEARQDTTVRKGILVRQASNLRGQIADAVASGDEDTARDLINQARQFDVANPAFAVLPTIGDTIRRRARISATAQALGSPLGVSPKDIQGQQITNYADY